ncbi:MAG: APC family permease [Microbacterium sp.]|uniref:APC family permease n=1 Tax=Microbacterium sp. TaxID=51671 RepID=UPI003BB04B07
MLTALERAIWAPAPVRDFAARSPLDGLDRRSVGFGDVLAQSVAAVAPSGAATTVILFASGVAGAATVLAVMVAAFIALLVATTVNQFTRRMVASGSLYTYAARGLGAAAGLTTGAALLVGYAGVAIFALLGGAHYLGMLAQRAWPALGGLPGSLVATALLLVEAAILTIVLVRGIRFSSRLAFVVELASVVIVAALMIVLLMKIGPFDLNALMPSELSLPALAAGAVIALTAFVGFESAATLGVEARSPLRNVPRAIVWTVIVAGGLYVLAGYTQVVGFRALGLDLAASASPVNTLATANGLDAWGVFVDVGIAASFLACAIASTTALTRVLFSMGRDGVAPGWLGRVHARHRTPTSAIALAVPVIVLIPVVVVLVGVGVWAAMESIIVVFAVGYITAYVIVCLAAPRFLRTIGELTLGPSVIAIVAALALVGGLITYLVVVGAAGNPGVWISAVIAVVAGAAIGWRLRRSARPLSRIGSYDEPTAAEVLGGVAHDGHV